MSTIQLAQREFAVSGGATSAASPEALRLQARVWTPAGGAASARPRTLLIVHGFGEHGGRYAHFAPALLQAKPSGPGAVLDRIVALDHRGHGLSPGLRGDAPSFAELISDTAEVARELAQEGELHLFGHSMGGLIATRLALTRAGLPIRSVLASSPLLGIATRVPLIKRLAAPVLGGWLKNSLGRIQLEANLDARDLARDPRVVDAYRADRLVHGKMTPRFYLSMVELMRDTQATTQRFLYPYAIWIAGQDRIADPQVARAFAARHASVGTTSGEGGPGERVGAATCFEHAESFHEVFNDWDQAQAFEEVRSWIRTHS